MQEILNTIALRNHQQFLSNGSDSQVTCVFKRLLWVRSGAVQSNTNHSGWSEPETGEEVAEGERCGAGGR